MRGGTGAAKPHLLPSADNCFGNLMFHLPPEPTAPPSCHDGIR